MLASPMAAWAESNSGLVIAAWSDQIERVQVLLDQGASVNSTTANGVTALMASAGRGHVAMVRLLLERGADPNLQDSTGRTALFMPSMLGMSHVVQLLLAHNADPNLASTDGLSNTPLHLAVANGRRRVMGYLIEAGADVCARDGSGATPLVLAELLDANRFTKRMLRRHGGDCEPAARDSAQ